METFTYSFSVDDQIFSPPCMQQNCWTKRSDLIFKIFIKKYSSRDAIPLKGGRGVRGHDHPGEDHDA
jgi:hypothetical protein